MTVVLKLGGSVVTRKDSPETVDDRALSDLAAALGEYEGNLVLVHGGGSFGHHHASRLGVSRTEGTHDVDDLLAVHDSMTSLNAAVLSALRGEGVPVTPVHPLSVCSRDRSGALSFPADAARTMVGEGFVPVTHGDVVTHEGKGATVVSGDELAVSLARSLSAARVGICSTVPGVLDEHGDVVPRIEAYDEVAGLLGESDETDVTGGMAAKVRELLALDAPASVFGPADLAAFLEGDDPGTRVG